MNSQKQENLLSLAIDSTEEERIKSGILNVGVDNETNRWEVIVKYHGNLERIANDEIQVEILIAGYAIVTLPAFLLEALTELEEVEYIEKPKSLVYNLYEAKIKSCITPVNVPIGELSGDGVFVAIIDSGIDYFLDDFRNEKGSRIRFLWDQSIKIDTERGFIPPEGFRSGVEFSKEQIDRALAAGRGQEAMGIVPSEDLSGHGTAVAAVAASSNKDILLQGVAPGSELLIVKLGATNESDFPSTTEIMRGVTYVIRKALEFNRPLVINLSFGNTYGSHDGSSLLERFLDNASEIGRTCICVGTGNEGSSNGHYFGNAKENRLVELAVAERESTLNVQLWKSYEDEFQISLVTPDKQEFRIIQEVVPARREFLFDKTKILVYTGVPAPYSTKQEIFFVFLPQEDYINSGIWGFRLEPKKITDGSFQMYLPPALQRNSGTAFFRANPELTMTIPATSTRVISVGAYNDMLDSYADFSGRGRQEGFTYVAAEGRKPDLAAPGVGILAAKAGGGTESYTGTSFATPLVAGSAALLLEWGIVLGNDPYLYGEKMKAYFRKGALPISGEVQYPNSKTGWGVLCVSRSLPI
ncbi:MAG: S8 family serine peptidase [Lachnospiraceae bacterium]|nr:S8 family serine peptidase [Lachnospiraceae bacterium]